MKNKDNKIITKGIHYLIISTLLIMAFIKGNLGDTVLIINGAIWLFVFTINLCRKSCKRTDQEDDEPEEDDDYEEDGGFEDSDEPDEVSTEKDNPARDAVHWYHFVGKPLLTDIITDLNTNNIKKLTIESSGDIRINSTDVRYLNDFPPYAGWTALVTEMLGDGLVASYTDDRFIVTW